MKLKLTDEQLRNLIRARMTKGDAFRLNNSEYFDEQKRIKEELNKLNRTELMERYKIYCYDVK